MEMLGINSAGQASESGDGKANGWNEAEREQLRAKIAARQPFLDFVFTRVNADGSKQQFQVSGEPKFSQSFRFQGYRGIGMEIAPKK